jgi:hypothetical protein
MKTGGLIVRKKLKKGGTPRNEGISGYFYENKVLNKRHFDLSGKVDEKTGDTGIIRKC